MHTIRVDENHGNPRKLWEMMGKPTYPNKQQMEQLYQESLIFEEPLKINSAETGCKIEFILPPQGIALIKFTK